MPALRAGGGRCGCAACGRWFGAVGGFDARQRLGRDGTVACLDPAGLGMVERGGWWVRAAPRIADGVGRDGANEAGAPSPTVRDPNPPRRSTP